MDEEYYVNKCNGSNELFKQPNRYGFKSFYKIEDKLVVMSYHQYEEEDGSGHDEIVSVDIKDWTPKLEAEINLIKNY